MKNFYKTILQILKDRRDRRIVIVAALVILMLLLFVPTFVIPGDTFLFQLQLFTVQDYILMALLSFMAGLIFALQWHSMRAIRSQKATSTAGSIFSGLTGLAGAAVSTLYCGCGAAVLLGFIGFGASSIFFFIHYQSYFLAGGILLLFISLYFAARKVGKCSVL